MQVSRRLMSLVSGFVIFGASSGLYAASGVALSTSNPSTITAAATDGILEFVIVNRVFLPSTTTTPAPAGSSLSSVTDTLSSTNFNFSFTQNIVDSNSSADGTASIFFTAASPTSFMISGNLSAFGTDYDTGLTVSLTDLTNQQEPYNYTNNVANFPVTNDVRTNIVVVNPTTALTLDSTGGSLTGALNPGDLYQFSAEEDLTNQATDPNLVGSVSIGFTPAAGVPLPRSASMGLLLMALLACAAKTHRAASKS